MDTDVGPRATGQREGAHLVCVDLNEAAAQATAKEITDKYGLLFSMACVGIAWSSILSMPYAMLAPSLPPDKLGVMMGIFNLFIVVPQVIASGLLGYVIGLFFEGKPMSAMFIGGISFAIAAVANMIVVTYKKPRKMQPA